jgi:acetyl esterase/lipase
LTKITGHLENAETNPAPVIDCYLPREGNSLRIGLIIFPGGAYYGLAEHEGKGYAEYFSGQGIASFVVTYRLGSQHFHHPSMIEDALSAIRTVRVQSNALDLDADKIGVMGSSAGGHLAASTLVGYHRYQSSISLRPDFGILCYPVITMQDPFTHKGSRENLLGGNADDRLIHQLSCETQVSERTPPCFIWHTVEDAGVPVENSMMFASALRLNGVPFELHCYEKGRHGMGLNTTFPWANDCVRWIKQKVLQSVSITEKNNSSS